MNHLNVKGTVLWQGDEHYEEARRNIVWNGRKPKRYPKLIVKVTDEEDVVEAVRYANDNNLKISIRAGGHSWAGWSVRDDALLIDLSAMQEIDLDPATGIVKASPAVKGGDVLDPFLEEHGLLFCGGHCPSVGLGGFLLQGGMGWNCRGWGWAAESIVGIDVVTAAGELVHANTEQHSDLFWAARGAGPGFFGVVTRFHLQTRPRPKAFTQSSYIYPMSCYTEVFTWIQEIHGTLSDKIELVVLSILPPLPPDIGHDGKHVIVVHALAFVDTQEEGTEILQPLESCPVLDQALIRDFAQPTSLAAERAEQVRANPEGHRFAVDNAWVTGDPADVVPALQNSFEAPPSAETFTLWFSMAPLRELPDMALSLQTEIYLALYVVWQDEADDDHCRSWLAERMEEVETVSIGQYLGDSDFNTRPSKFVGDENYMRLEEIRRRYDPNGRFHSYLAPEKMVLNQNRVI